MLRTLFFAAALATAFVGAVRAQDTDPENTLVLQLKIRPVVIKMLPDVVPKHVAQIKKLVRQKFYDGIIFHRVIDGFMAQTGDPTGTGTGGSGKKLKAEFSKEPHVRGTVSMARAANPDSGDSQFFICFADSVWLNGPVHGMGQGDRRHGECRQDQARRARARPGQHCLAEGRGRTRSEREMPFKALFEAAVQGSAPPSSC